MAINLPKVHIPIVVSTTGMDSQLKAAETKLKRSTQRMQAQAPAGKGMAVARAGFAGLGSLGGMGPLTGVLGAGMAAGPVGAMAAGAAIPLAVASALNNMIDQATKGATAALKEFRETGRQTFAANSVILERLAAAEQIRQRNQMPTVGQAFTGAMVTEGGQLGGAASWAQSMKEGLTIAAGFAGAQLAGKSMEVSALEASLAATTDESMAKRTRELIALVESRQAEQNVFEQMLDRMSLMVGILRETKVQP